MKQDIQVGDFVTRNPGTYLLDILVTNPGPHRVTYINYTTEVILLEGSKFPFVPNLFTKAVPPIMEMSHWL